MAQYYYFKPSGKWKYEGEGLGIPEGVWKVNHDFLRHLNNGKMPGIITSAKDFIVVVIDEDSFPRLIFPEENS